MNKKLFLTAFLSLPLSFSAYANLKFDPAKLDRFYKTGSCQNCDLSNAKIHVPSKIHQPFNLQGADISNSSIEFDNDLSHEYSNYTNLTAIGTIFGNHRYAFGNFKGANLRGAKFVGANLRYANFRDADVHDVDFSGAKLWGTRGINFKDVKSVCNADMPDGSRGTKGCY